MDEYEISHLIGGLRQLSDMQKDLMDKMPHGHVIKPEHQASVVAAVGLMEEVHEYINSLGFKSWRPTPQPREEQLEELTDVLFFYLELQILSGFSWHEIIGMYGKKHAINLKRYEDAMRGDFDWDKRSEKRSL